MRSVMMINARDLDTQPLVWKKRTQTMKQNTRSHWKAFYAINYLYQNTIYSNKLKLNNLQEDKTNA